MSALWVFLGGGLGAVSRWGVSLLAPQPWATVAVNLFGCALLAGMMHPSMRLSEPWKLTLATGFMGSFTTYSTYNLLLLTSLREHDARSAALQLGITLLGGLLAGAAGWALVGWWRGAA